MSATGLKQVERLARDLDAMRAHNLPPYRPKRDGERAFGVDYDHTYTVCPAEFDGFIRQLLALGHRVYFITYRNADDCDAVILAADALGIGMLATGGQKKRAAAEAHGIFVDVWIDDTPEFIV
jgi:hypothetical protein